MINKKASRVENFRRNMHCFRNARSAFQFYLELLRFTSDETVLLPAYIGWSEREGSGVFDPVRTLGLRYAFYGLDRNLNIDLKSLQNTLETTNVKLFVIIHYFGFIDPAYELVVKLVRRHGARVLEDEAHSFLTNFYGGKSGKLGDASIFSLHKIFPFEEGGLLSISNTSEALPNVSNDQRQDFSFIRYDFSGISERRRENATRLGELLKNSDDRVSLLQPEFTAGEVPQSCPVVIRQVSRDALYDLMNEAGFGVVSLYHTLIDEISQSEFPDCHYLSKRILNLPVHQDVTIADLELLVDTLFRMVRKLESSA